MELLNMHVLLSSKLEEAKIELVLTFSILGLWVVYDMGDSGNNKSSHKMSRTEMESFSLDASRFSRDFLTRFMGTSSSNSGSREAKTFGHYDDDNDDDDDELNLGLSLGGRFGVDKSSKNNKLIRSSSIAACLPIVRDDNDAVSASASAAQPVALSSLVRTSSLPVETEEEWRKRKELQTLRRMEAKRRRSVKQRKAEREGLVSSTTTGEEEKKDSTETNLRREQQCLAAAKRFSSSVTAPPPTARQSVVGVGGRGIEAAMSKGKGSSLGTNLLGQLLLSQGSVESQGGSFSSELGSTKSLQGSNSCSDLSQLSQKINEQDIGSSSRTRTEDEPGRTTSLAEVENPSKKPDATNRGKESKKNTLEEMPCVFTKGDGPYGRRVDGILYKYGKGEEVRIMCVCHGNFLSPAEFIKHAGGTDVAHPLKHIVVNPNASPFP